MGRKYPLGFPEIRDIDLVSIYDLYLGGWNNLIKFKIKAKRKFIKIEKWKNYMIWRNNTKSE